jgi:hypothetical protein
MNWETYLNFPLTYRRWLINRIQKELEESSKKGNQVPSKGQHHHSPDARAMTGMGRTHVPAKLKRFT